MFRILGVVLIFFLFCPVVHAEHELSHTSRKANQSDIIGLWKMSYQIINPKMTNNSLFFANFQVFDFDENNFVKNIASKKNLKDIEISQYFESMSKTVEYSFTDDGLLEIKRSKRDFDNIVISIITTDMKTALRDGAPLMKKGDLIMTYLDQHKQLYMQRFLSRMTLPDIQETSEESVFNF